MNHRVSEYRLEIPSAVDTGGAAPTSLHVINASGNDVELISAKPPHEILVRDASGQLVWSSLITTSCPNTWVDPSECSYMTGFRISAGAIWDFAGHEAKTLSANWPTTNIEGEHVVPGDYFATAVLSISDDDCTGCDLETVPTKITVTP